MISIAPKIQTKSVYKLYRIGSSPETVAEQLEGPVRVYGTVTMSLLKLKGIFSKKKLVEEDSNVGVEESQEEEDFQPAKMFLTHWDSICTLTSYYSADGGLSGYPISGSILLKIWFKKGILSVHVAKANDLPGVKAGGLSDPYVKTQILPDLSRLTKRKTTIQRKTNDPIFDTTLKTQLSQSDINTSTLCATVWDWDMFGRNQFLGEVHVHLSSLDLTRPRDRWYMLRDKKCNVDEGQYKGSIVFSVMYMPHYDLGTLYIKVTKANNLQINHEEGTNFSVRIFLLPDQSTFTKKKTACIADTKNPVWDEHFEYKYVSLGELETNRVLEVSVWDFDRRGCNDFIGCVRLGPAPDRTTSDGNPWMDSMDIEANYWKRILGSPQQWVEVQLELRPTIASRFAEQPTFNEDSDYSVDCDDEEDESDDDDESLSSIGLYSDGETRGKCPITGSLLIMVEHENQILSIHILNSKDLAAADSNGLSDPYVKLYMLPDKHTKRQTEVKKKTLNPVYNEIMQYEVDEDELSQFTLWFTVWNWNRFEKNQFLGEVRLPLSNASINGSPEFYELSDNIEAETESGPASGELTLALKFEEVSFQKGKLYGKLHVHIRSAGHLANMETGGHTDSYVKMYLLPDKKPASKRKTNIVKQNYYPTWNEWFEYDQITKEQLSTNHILEVTVWDHHFTSRNDFLGGLRLGPTPSLGETEEWIDSNILEARQWEEMLDNPGQWVEYCHKLRPTMDYRDVAIIEQEQEADKEMHDSKDSAIPSQSSDQSSVRRPNKFMTQQSSTLLQSSRSAVHKLSSSVKIKKRHPKAKKSYQKMVSSSTIDSEGGALTIALKFERISIKKGETYGKLFIHIIKAQQLPCRSDGGCIDGYAKIYLLPDKKGKTKQKSKVIKNSSDPNWNEKLVYDKVTLEQLSSAKVLEVTVWDHHVLASNYSVGGIRLGPTPNPGVTEDWVDSNTLEAKQWKEVLSNPGQWVEYCHALRPTMEYRDVVEIEEELRNQQQQDTVEEDSMDTVSQLTLLLMFEVTSQRVRTKGNLHVHIKDAELSSHEPAGDKIFTKCRLLPSSAYSGGSMKTSIIKISSNPFWDEAHTFNKLFQDELIAHCALEVTLWDISDDSHKSFMGGLHIGPNPDTTDDDSAWLDSTGKEVEHWEAIFNTPGEWIKVKHTLRQTMN